MFRKYSSLFGFSLLILCLSSTTLFAQKDKTSAETVVHLLSYVASDYAGAVQNGKIISQSEYQEQVEFSGRALEITKTSSFLKGADKTKVLQMIQGIVQNIHAKKSDAVISKDAGMINNQIIKLAGLKTAPQSWPSLAKGQQLYQNNCAVCHGTTGQGNGPGSKGLDPQPVNFLDHAIVEALSPYKAHNSIQLGVPGTAMQPFSNLTQDQIWDLAFYVKSLWYKKESKDTILLRKAFNEARKKVSLEDVATMDDHRLLDTLKVLSPQNSREKLIALRTMEPTAADLGNSLPVARENLQKALEFYKKGNKEMARSLAISAYLEGIEPVEARLRNADNNFVPKIETQMFKVRQAIDQNKSAEQLSLEIQKANDLINQADTLLQDQKMGYGLTFLIAMSIVLREGLEAFLILAVILALIKATGAKKALPWVHGGWITALICGVIGWFTAGYILKFGGKNREILEGGVSILAVIILVSAGFWMHNKTYAAKWTHFIKDKIGGMLQKDRMFGLAAFSFVIVFREAFEVILFLQALSLEATSSGNTSILLGTVAAVVSIFIIGWIFLKYTKKIPLHQIFKWSSFLIVILAIVLMGKGIHSLQESGLVSVTNLSFVPRIEWLGVYSSLECVLSQLGLIILIVIVYFVNKRKMEKQAVVQSVEDKKK